TPLPSQHIRMAFPLPLEQFLPANPLAVAAISNFEPSRLVLGKVRCVPVLRNNSLKVSLAGEPEQPLAILLNVVAIKQPLAAFGNNGSEAELTVAERQIAYVLAVAESSPLLLVIRPSVPVPQDVKCVEPGFAAPEQQVSKLGLAGRIKAHDFPIEDAPASPQV